MQHFPIFLDLAARRVVLGGGGQTALAKLRLLLRTRAKITVFAQDPIDEVVQLARAGAITLVARRFDRGDALCARLAYAAHDDADEDARMAAIARAEGALVNWVDHLEASDFLTPAIVDRDPVVVAIGTEGSAPVLARRIKGLLEAALPAHLGLFAKAAALFRATAERLQKGGARREFWDEYFDRSAPEAFAKGGADALAPALEQLLTRHETRAPAQGHVAFVGAGPGDPDLLTIKARRALDRADVVLYDRLISREILDLARREAVMIDVGKEGFGASMPQAAICAALVEHAQTGAQVVRLKSGDPTIFGRLDEEIDALAAHGIGYEVVAGVTSACAAAAQIGQSLTRRARNSSLRLLTGHDVAGFAEQDWRGLSRAGEVAAIYMGKRGARFLQGRLLMHGASPATPVTIIVNASRADSQIMETTLARLVADLDGVTSGPAMMLYGLAPRATMALGLPQKAQKAALS